MKVELQIDGSQMGDTIQEVFKNLTPEQRTELAKSAMMEWLKSPIDFERCVYESKLIEEIRNDRHGYYKNKSDAEIRDNYDFRERVKKFRSTKEKMVEEIVAETIRSYKESVKELISKDEQIQAMLAVVREEIKKSFPAMAQDAITVWFASNMDSIATTLIQMKHNDGFGSFSRDLQERLNNMKYLPDQR